MLRCIFCDVLCRPEWEFWQSTIREITERYDTFAEFKGWKKPVETVQAKRYKPKKGGK